MYAQVRNCVMISQPSLLPGLLYNEQTCQLADIIAFGVCVCVPGHEAPLTEWEYMPPVGPRPHKGFVGLKNAGATCYMNSVLQQVGGTAHLL